MKMNTKGKRIKIKLGKEKRVKSNIDKSVSIPSTSVNETNANETGAKETSAKETNTKSTNTKIKGGKSNSIGKKIYPFLVIIFVLICAYGYITISGLTETEATLETISEDYLALLTQNELVTRNISDGRAYASLAVYVDNQAKSKEYAGMIQTSIDATNAALGKMNTRCLSLKEKDLTAAFADYQAAVLEVQDNMTKTARLLNEGKKNDAKALSEKLQDLCVSMQSAQTAFAELLSGKSSTMGNDSVDKISTLETLVLVLGGAFAFIILFTIIIMSRTVIKPARTATKQLTNIISDIDNNEGDLTQRISIKTKDEIGQMAIGINTFIGQLQGIMKQLADGSSQMDVQINHINDNIIQCENGASDVSATMQQMSASMQEISASIEQINSNSQVILNNAKDMYESAEGGTAVCESIKQKAETIKNETLESKDVTVRIMSENKESLQTAIEHSRNVSKINELTGEILSIASQTNLLALNASIEAARAGEAGKGFAVVANEIRNLADNSQKAANNIQTVSDMVNQAINQLANNANEMLDFIDSTVLTDYDKFVNIANLYHSDADNIDEMMSNFRAQSEHLEKTLGEVSEGINGISIAVEENAKGVSTVADNTGNLVAMLAEIKDNAESNQEISNGLQAQVTRFKAI